MKRWNKMIKHFNRQFIMFCIAGLVNTSVDWSIYFIISNAIKDITPFIPKTIGAIFGITSAFILSSCWVFKDNFLPRLGIRVRLINKCVFIMACYLKFLASYAAGMIINVTTFTLLYNFGLYEILSLITATFFSLIFNFTASKKFVFVGTSY